MPADVQSWIISVSLHAWLILCLTGVKFLHISFGYRRNYDFFGVYSALEPVETELFLVPQVTNGSSALLRLPVDTKRHPLRCIVPWSRVT